MAKKAKAKRAAAISPKARKDGAPDMRRGARASPLQPSAALLTKIGRICVHLYAYTHDGGHVGDWVAAKTVLQDPEVIAWLAQMNKLALLPVMKNKPR